MYEDPDVVMLPPMLPLVVTACLGLLGQHPWNQVINLAGPVVTSITADTFLGPDTLVDLLAKYRCHYTTIATIATSTPHSVASQKTYFI